MTVIAEIQVAPSPPGTADDPHAHVEAAIAVIQASGLRYEVGALGTTLDHLVESGADDDVVIRPHRDAARGITTWLLSRDRGQTISKMRVTRKVPEELRVHPGRDWFTVLSGTIVLRLGERTILVGTNEAAEFSTMVPHALTAPEGTAEILAIYDQDGERAHLHDAG